MSAAVRDDDPARPFAEAASRKEAANAERRKKKRVPNPYLSAALVFGFVFLTWVEVQERDWFFALIFSAVGVMHTYLAWKHWPRGGS